MSHRYRLYPTAVQEAVMVRHCADARFVWNLALEQANCWRRNLGPTPTWVVQGRQLTEARQGSWLGEGSASVQKMAVLDFHQAMRGWWEGHKGRPTWRCRGVHEGFVIKEVTIRKRGSRWSDVTVPKCGRVKLRLSRPLPEKYGMGRVTLDPAGRWHVSFSASQPPVEREATGAVVGVDLGVAATVMTSDARQLDAPGLIPTERARYKRLQRKMSRQVKGSNRRARTKHAIAVLAAREKDRRKDWAEKVSTDLVRDHDVIVFEDLKVRQMMRSASGTVEQPGHNVAQKRGLNRSIGQQSWALLARRTQDKAEASGVLFVKVHPAYTSQTCAECGHVDAANRRGQAVFRCTGCGHTANADVNAARNILAAGLAVTARGGTPEVGAPVEARTSSERSQVARRAAS